MIPGDRSKNHQELLEKTSLKSRSHEWARVWRMRCSICDTAYGCNGSDAHLWLCPLCQGGQPSEPLPEDGTDAELIEDVALAIATCPEPPMVRKTPGRNTCFDAYIMVDWSSGSGLRAVMPVANAPWIAEAWWDGGELAWAPQGYFRGRRTCIDHLVRRLRQHIGEERRVLLCFDFAYGYPVGYGLALGFEELGFWKPIWDEISLPTLAPGMAGEPPKNDYATANNRNNRFAVAAHLNERVHRGHQPPLQKGPLYGCPRAHQRQFLVQANPGFPYPYGAGVLQHFRATERRLQNRGFHPLSVWWVLGGGAPVVGGQVLTGIPAVREIRYHAEFVNVSKIWPLETAFTVHPSPITGPYIVHAEIWPGIVNDQLEEGLIRDEAQVRAMVRWAAMQDASGGLGNRFQRPPDLTDHEVLQCENEEGWVLGA